MLCNSFFPAKPLAAAALVASLAFSGLASAQTITSASTTLVEAGNVITISGTGLSDATQALLNGQPMPITARGTGSNGTLSVKVPIGASSGYLRLTTPNGTATGTQRIRVKRKSASYRAAPKDLSGVDPAPSGYSTPMATDLDGDGRIDLLVGNANGCIRNFEQTTVAGNFPDAGVFLTSAGSQLSVHDYAKPTVTDLDGDGLLDLLVGTGTDQRIMRYEQLGGNNLPTAFGAGTLLTTNGTTEIRTANYPKPAIADLDGDGLLDLLVGDDNGRIMRYEQVATTGTAARHFVLRASTLMAGAIPIDVGITSRPTVVDWDGDGLLDLLIGNRAGKVYHCEQTQPNGLNFSSLDEMMTPELRDISAGDGGVNNNYAAPTVTDVDGDGLLDLLLGSNNGCIIRFEQEAAHPVTPLPVVLTAFGGQGTAAGFHLAWTTAQEVQSASFVVEASADGRTFAAVAELAAAGTSTTARSYQYLDASAIAQAATARYYRLRQVDVDGTVAYSPVVALRREAHEAGPIATYPSPFAETLSVALPGSSEPQATAVTLLTLAGRTVYTANLQLGAAPQVLTALPLLPAGVYVLRLATNTGSTTRKVTRQ